MELAPYLGLMVSRNASDPYFSPGTKVNVEIEDEDEVLHLRRPFEPRGREAARPGCAPSRPGG